MPQAVFAIMMTPHDAWKAAQLWEKLGVPGTTILASVGYDMLKERVLQDDFPLFSALKRFVEDDEIEVSGSQRILLSVVADDFDVKQLLDETESMLQAFDSPNSGIAFVIPVLHVRGLRSRLSRSDQTGKKSPLEDVDL